MTGAGFLVLALGFCALLWPVCMAQLNRRAHRAWRLGHRRRAEGRWRALQRWPLVGARVRSDAALSLANLALERGDWPEAERCFSAVTAGAGVPWAAAGLALVATVQGDLALARERILAASATGRAAQAQVDGVRALWLLASSGPEEALALIDSLVVEDGLLLRAVGAVARGDADPDLAADLRRTSLRAIPQLAPLVDAPGAGASGRLLPDLA